MEINVAHMLKSAVGTTRSYDLDVPEHIQLDDDLPATITGGSMRLDRTNSGILVRGHATASVMLTCSRCLEPVDTATAVELAEEYEPSIDVTTGKPLPPPERDLVFVIGSNHVLDLSEALRQNVLSALPIQPLCRPDCRGLCPVCGTNKNLGECDCIVADANHPLAALADLLPKSG